MKQILESSTRQNLDLGGSRDVDASFDIAHRYLLADGWNAKKTPFGKRVFDMIFAGCVLLFGLPLMLVIAALVRWTSDGPIFFWQYRVGQGGRLFKIYKFRSMYVTSDPYAKTPDSDDNDVRVTSVGRLLRKTSLDELPQFYNVLRGDMSIVGPRPEMPFWVNEYSPRQLRRLRVLPGITGPWQLSPARKAQIHENLHYDLYYIRKQSFLFDAYVIASTFFAIVHVAFFPTQEDATCDNAVAQVPPRRETSVRRRVVSRV